MEDFFHFDDLIPESDKILRDSLRRFVDEEVTPIMADAYEQAHFPQHFIQRSAELGLLGMNIPEIYGGIDASPLSSGIVYQELERGDSGLRSFVSVQSALCIYPIFTFGSEAQKQKYLPRLATADLIGCFGLTEPDTGSNPGNMKTVAKKTDTGWILNGSKLWITNAPIANIAIVWAKTEEGVRGFIVEKDFPGFTANEIKAKMSLRASSTGELVFDDCFVPHENLLPGSDIGLRAALSCLTQARYGIAFGAIGAAMACYDIALDYVKTREQFDKPLASHQLIQHDLVMMLTEICKAQSLNFHLAALKEKGEANHLMVSMAKMNSCQQALKIARQCRNLLGANGISLEYHVIRHMTNLESVYTYEGTHNIHTLAIGNHITGINAFG